VPGKPSVNHGTSQRFGLLAVPGYDLSGHFDVARMNGYDPLIALDPGADGVSYSLILHIRRPGARTGNSATLPPALEVASTGNSRWCSAVRPPACLPFAQGYSLKSSRSAAFPARLASVAVAKKVLERSIALFLPAR